MAAKAERTDPELWEKVKHEVMHGDKGGHPDEWSARKAQLAVQEYRKRGGGYKGRKSSDNHLLQWEREGWGTKSGRKSTETGERYLPRKAREQLSSAEYARTTAKKRRDSRVGRQFSAQPEDVARKTASLRDNNKGSGRARPAERGAGKTAEPFDADNKRAVAQEFRRVVNMSPARLRAWLQERASRSVGMRQGGEKVTEPGGREAVGHAMGRRILDVRGKRQSELTDDDIRAMRKVIGYVHRHLKQRPEGDVTDTRWRKSLMNWGHDPLR